MTNEHGKQKSHLISSTGSSGGGGGNGIAGLLVFGGALAFAGFIAVKSFVTNKNKAKAKGAHENDPLTKPKPKLQQLLLDDSSKSQQDLDHDHEIETTQVLNSLLQPATTPNSDGDSVSTSHETSNTSISQTNSTELLPTQTLILEEEKIDPNHNAGGEVDNTTCFRHEEIVLCDDSHPQSVASSNENGIVEGGLVSLIDSPAYQAQEVDQDEPQESLKSLETETNDDDSNRNNDNEDDVVLESGKEDGSKATEGISLNSIKEPVWPAELIEEAEQDLKGEGVIIDDIQSEAQGTAKTNISDSAELSDSHACSDTDADGSDQAGTNGAMTVTPEATTLNDEKANFFVVLNDQSSLSSYLFQLRTWLIPTLLLSLLLLLVLLIHRIQQSFYVLHEGDSVIIP